MSSQREPAGPSILECLPALVMIHATDNEIFLLDEALTCTTYVWKFTSLAPSCRKCGLSLALTTLFRSWGACRNSSARMAVSSFDLPTAVDDP